MTDEKTHTKIICYRGDRSACFFYRIHAPMAALARNNKTFEITVAGFIDKKQLDQYDVAIFQRQYKEEVFLAMLEMKKARGTKIIYEIDDDLFNIPEWNPAYKILGKQAIQDNIKHFLNQSDACFVTNEYLASIYSPYCKQVFILPNSLDFSRFNPPSNNSARPVVLWQGSTTHSGDLKIVQKSLQKIVEDERCTLKLWSLEMPGAYNVPNVPFEAFFPMFSQVDGYIGLAPLTTIPFNRSKSNLKFLEYTAMGMATIASNFGPYAETIEHMESGILVSDNSTWYDAVDSLLSNKDLYNKIVANAQTLVQEKFDIAKNYVYWEQALNHVIGVENV